MDLKELGLEVRRLRRERGLSQQQVAEHIMMSRVECIGDRLSMLA